MNDENPYALYDGRKIEFRSRTHITMYIDDEYWGAFNTKEEGLADYNQRLKAWLNKRDGVDDGADWWKV